MVHIIGAGPGDIELITVKAMKLLQKTNVIIYAGSLINHEILKYASSDCELYNSSSMTLDEVIEIINLANNKNKDIVRLHSGDPSIFGAIREQIDIMDKLNIKYEIIPGVSSFCAAAAVLNKEYTLPNVSQTVILTRMEGRTPVPQGQDINELAKHRATMVIFLSIHMIDEVVKKLLCGYNQNTPVAVVYKATWKEQKIIHGTLEDIVQKIKSANINKTALITVGDFLGSDYELSKLYDSNFEHEYRKLKVHER